MKIRIQSIERLNNNPWYKKQERRSRRNKYGWISKVCYGGVGEVEYIENHFDNSPTAYRVIVNGVPNWPNEDLFEEMFELDNIKNIPISIY